MTLRALLEKILNTYLQEKNKPLKGNSLAKCLRSGLKNVVSDDLISGSLITKGSPGQGSWAIVPCMDWAIRYDNIRFSCQRI